MHNPEINFTALSAAVSIANIEGHLNSTKRMHTKSYAVTSEGRIPQKRPNTKGSEAAAAISSASSNQPSSQRMI